MEESWLQKSTKILVALLLVAGALDAATTFIGTQPRNYYWADKSGTMPDGSTYTQRVQMYQVNPETRVAFFPFFSTVIFGIAIYAIRKISIKTGLSKWGSLISFSFIPIAFIGGINNLFVLGGI